ncbi:hypothetical protein J437_LFUL018937 [Ladona fulva]|uniref:Pyrrolo-quinoline quinone repeat domain-containing protein n=1 Tax=Ladona fulva TaxID=123851 RepID=A0A8K0KUB7_LADFU|nr:hypothetical protein J437_LFUL018937 [Ladona fulva]
MWSFVSGNMIKSSPVLVNNGLAVAFGSYDEYLYCVNAQNGELVWKVKPGLGAIYSSPCLVLKNVMGIDQSNVSTEDTLLSTGVILIGTLGGTCAAVSEMDGRILWSHDIQAPVFTSSLNYNSRALFSSVKGKVKCFLTNSGEERYKRKFGYHLYIPYISLYLR